MVTKKCLCCKKAEIKFGSGYYRQIYCKSCKKHNTKLVKITYDKLNIEKSKNEDLIKRLAMYE